jgi:hypothetical protein
VIVWQYESFEKAKAAKALIDSDIAGKHINHHVSGRVKRRLEEQSGGAMCRDLSR